MSQSIEDLILASKGQFRDESPQANFFKKQAKLKAKAMEKQTAAKAAGLGVPYIDLFGFPISPEALRLFSKEDSRKFKCVFFYYDGANLRAASTDPLNQELGKIVDKISKKLYTTAQIYLISQRSLDYAIRLYDTLPKISKPIPGVQITADDLEKFQAGIKDYRGLNDKINDVNMSDAVTLILATAIKMDSSDVHIEAEESGVVVRLRVDGVLQEAAVIEKSKWPRIVSRMKLLAKVKLNIADRPQDGRFTIFLPNDKIAIRSSFLPTAFGESVVMRLLKSSSVGLTFEDLGISIKGYEILGREIAKPNGLILTTGPTGSGKTTTLYAILNKLNKPGTKIITLEDPIEYQLEGINQSQVNEKKGYTFATGLRSILRQDPDIVMVGEIRDLETAEIAVQASLTGHLVLSTLHTNDSAGVIPRLVDMGIKPYFLTPSINAVIGQRLVRKLCQECKIKHKLNEKEEAKVRKILAVISPKAQVNIPTELPIFYQANESGCEACGGIGYKGRVGIYEILPMDKDLKEIISKETPAFKILEQAIENGMITMLQDGILKCLNGLTSLKEVYRVIGKTDYIDALYDIAISQALGRAAQISPEDIAQAEKTALDLTTAQEAILEKSPQDAINFILALAVRSRTGDIHIEPTENAVKARFRIDGIMTEIVTMPKDYYLPILSQIKVLAGIPTNVKKAAWDSRFGINLNGEKVDCRLSIISGGYGETIAIRILTQEAFKFKMSELGIRGNTLKIIQKSIKHTKGIVITTGPTGSGKTTTLYSILSQLNNPDTKIITIEDPIEYKLEGIMQTQVKGDYTFASAMRSLMRQNPNIIMVGEIRDTETAQTAIEAAMTGHLVLSTIHANSAAGAISRFVGLGIERTMLKDSINATVGQRLARKLCPNCRERTVPEGAILEEVKQILASINPAAGAVIPELRFYKAKGCEKCNNLGYKGQIGIYETIDMNPEMQMAIQNKQITKSEIEKIAMANGTLLILQDGILKALEGLTTIEEVFRVAR